MEIFKDKVVMESSYGKKVTVELEAPDSTISEMLEAVVTCLLGLTYHPNSIYKAMKEYVEEYEEENYIVSSC